MPRNGANVYSLPPNTAAGPSNTPISSAKANSVYNDIAADLNTPRPIVAGGTGASTAVDSADAFSTKGADIASAATTDIGAATGRYVHITGTSAITSFGTKTAGVVRILTFDGALTLTHNATSLILPGGGNILTAAGDVAVFISEGGGNWRCVSYSGAAGATTDANVRLTLSGGNLLLSRFNGKRLTINGGSQIVPSAGVTLAATGLTPSTLYYIYAFMNSGTMTLEASTTVPVADTATGVQIKTGDATRTLVGMARPVAGPAWVDSATQRFVLSYYNRVRKIAQNGFTISRAISSTTFVEIHSEIRTEFLSWGDSAQFFNTDGCFYTNPGAGALYARLSLDGISDIIAETLEATALNYTIPLALSAPKLVSTGYHYATLAAQVSSGSGNFPGAAGNAGIHIFTTVEG